MHFNSFNCCDEKIIIDMHFVCRAAPSDGYPDSPGGQHQRPATTQRDRPLCGNGPESEKD